MTYRCASAACPMAAVNLPEPAAKALGLRCSVCGGSLAEQAKSASPWAEKTIVGVEFLPSILAIPLREYLDESNPVLRLWQACDFVELTLRLLVMAGVADLCRGGELSPSVLGDIRSRIARPTLGSWRGMAEAVARASDPARTVLPELRLYVLDTLAPFLDGQATPATPETSFSELRNRLAHGGGIPKAYAARLTAIWSEPFRTVVKGAEWLGEASLLVRGASGEFGLLRGPSVKPGPAEGIDPKALAAASGSPGSVVLARGPHVLTLWPLALYGEPLRPGEEKPQGLGEATQIYTRTGEVRLQYTPLGVNWVAQSESTDEALTTFRRLFRLEDHSEAADVSKPTVRGFEGEIRKDAADMIGRGAEVAQLASLFRERIEGVAWVHGEAGSGKSYLLAAAVVDLLDHLPDGALLLPYRFKAGDDRCGRESFLRFTIERLEAWDGICPETKDANKPDLEKMRPFDRLRTLLDRVDKGRRVVFVLDGLDEMAGTDARFAEEVPLALRLPRVLWLCASRPERGLPEEFRGAKAEEPWPEGLPRMTEDAVRAMLLERIQTSSRLRKRLLEGDREEGAKGEEKIVNSFVNRVTKNAAGLPIYVRYVVNDILGGKLSPEPSADLPPSLAEYHERLLERCEIGDLRQVLTPLVATLAVAHESLTPEALTDLLARRTIVREGETGLALVRLALSAVESIVRRSSTPDGDEGFTLFHASFREHVLTSSRTVEATATAREALAKSAAAPEPTAGKAAFRYLYRWGVSHLLEAGLPQVAIGLLTDFGYLMGRLKALPAPDGTAGIAADWRRIPSATAMPDSARIWEVFFREREHLLRRGDEDWTSDRILLQLASEHAIDSPITAAEEAWRKAKSLHRSILHSAWIEAHIESADYLRILEGHHSSVCGISECGAGKIISWSRDGSLRLWRIDTGEQLLNLHGHEGAVQAVVVSPDGTVAVSGGADRTIRIWNLVSGTCESVLSDCQTAVTALAMFPDHRTVASGEDDGTIRIWDIISRNCQQLPAGHTSMVSSLVAVDQVTLISAGYDGAIRVWDDLASEKAGKVVFAGEQPVDSLAAFSDQGTVVASVRAERSLKIFNVSSGECTRTIPYGDMFGERIAAGTDSFSVAVSDAWFENDEAVIRFFSTTTGELLREVRCAGWSCTCFCLLSADSGIVVAHLDGRIKLLKRDKQDLSASPKLRRDIVRGLAFHPDGDRVISVHCDWQFNVWELATGKLLRSFLGKPEWIGPQAILSEGKMMVTAKSGNDAFSLDLWELPSGNHIRRMLGHTDRITSVVADPAGRRVASSSEDKTVRVWDIDTGECIQVLSGHSGRVVGAAYDAAFDTWLSCTRGGEIKIWSANTFQCANTIHLPFPVSGLAVLGEGRVAAFLRDHGERLVVIDTETWKLLSSWLSHKRFVCLSAGKSHFAVGGLLGEVVLLAFD